MPPWPTLKLDVPGKNESCQRQGTTLPLRHRSLWGCKVLWILRELCKPSQGNIVLLPNAHSSPGNSSSAPPELSSHLIWRRSSVESMRNILMDSSPKEEAGANGAICAAGGSSSPKPDRRLDGRQDCRVLVGYPETDLQPPKVYHVSIISDMPACSRQTLKRAPSESLSTEAPRSPKRTLWDHPISGPHGQIDLDGLIPDSSFSDDGDFEDGLLSEQVPLCGSAQHFSHSGLYVTEHREESSSTSDLVHRQQKVHTVTGCPQTDPPTNPTQASLHISCPVETQQLISEERSTHHVGNGTSVPLDRKDCNKVEVDTSTQQHILDIVLHNIAQPERPSEKAPHTNGNLPAWSEPLSPQLQDRKLQETEGLNSMEKTPPGPSRLCTPGTAAVKRKLLPSNETMDSCSEDEGHSKRWKGGQGYQTLQGVCRSTDSKAAPFWNHLLPAARNLQTSSSDCTGRRSKRALRLKSRTLSSSQKGLKGRTCTGNWATSFISRPLLGNFEESILRGRFAPSGHIEGFTAEIGESGSYLP
ncbi:hypothetical protein GDO86_020652 [Hymenochirus boettgeri]|uniref:Atos-like conserved domain-containing protein n=1 Tax=Hymenochirus boettgeri TaxID=247094 RepID=A0A8T2II30_9PIPI|nr:hypothetical protein GDO86_020652 [Hymenochirus boettgeri]